MPKTPQIIDESGDKKYFTIIPNYITNHSSIWEQGAYLTMKRIAGENGKCFASQKELARRLEISQPTMARIIKKLVSRGWIEQEGFQAGKTRPIKCWRIIDLWQLNTNYYKKKIDKPQNKEEDIIEEDNTSATLPNGKYRCPNKLEGHKGCIEFIDSVANFKHKKTFTNYQKQIYHLHKMLRSGYTFKDIDTAIDKIDSDSFYQEKGWDLATIANIFDRV